jgi:hypothetical protein
MEIAKHADIRSAQNAGKPHGHRHTLDCLVAQIRRNFDRLKKGIEDQTGHFDFQNDFSSWVVTCNSARLLEAFIFTPLRSINAGLLAVGVHKKL